MSTPQLRERLERLDFQLPNFWALGRDLAPGMAIDESYSLDRDDAVSAREPDGNVLHVSITDVGSYLYDEPLVRLHAMRTTVSLYGFEKVIRPMVPRAISEGILSLLPDGERPVLTARLPIGTSYGEGLPTFAFERLQAEAVTPAEMSQRVAADDAQSVALASLARRLYALRTRDLGDDFAITNEFGEAMTGTVEELIGSLIVRESAIAYNHMIARFAVEHNIPIPFRVCRPKTNNDGFESPRAKYSIIPSEHSDVQVSAYAHGSSPLRRQPDNIVQSNVAAFLHDRPFPYDRYDVRWLVERMNRFDEQNAARRHKRTATATATEPVAQSLAG